MEDSHAGARPRHFSPARTTIIQFFGEDGFVTSLEA